MYRQTIKNHSWGFTVIQGLVVILIIGVVAAVLFSVLTAAKGDKYQASCAGNLKELGVAFMMYAKDYDGAFPDAVAGYDNPKKWGIDINNVPGVGPRGCVISWDERLNQGYVKSAEHWVCPGLGKDGTSHAYALYEPTPEQPFLRNYVVTYDYAHHGRNKFYKIRDYKKPAKKILLAEATSWRFHAQTIETYGDKNRKSFVNYMPPANFNGSMWEDNPEEKWCNLAWNAHNNAANYLMADGHVRFMKYGKTVNRNSKIPPYKDMWHVNASMF